MRLSSLALVLVLVVVACAGPDRARVELLRRAEMYEAQGRWLEAGEAWQRARQADRGDADAARGLARALVAQGDPIGGLAVLEGARADLGDDPRLCFDLARRREAAGNPDGALEALLAAGTADPDWAAPRIEAGRQALRLGRFDQARAQLEQAVAIDGDVGDENETWSLLARARESTGDAAGALDAWLHVLRSDARDVDAAVAAGTLAVATGERLEEVAVWLGSARREAPQRADVQQLYAALTLELGRGDEALAALHRALEIDPGDLAVAYRLATLHAGRGEREPIALLAEHARAVGSDEDAVRIEALLEGLEEPDVEEEEVEDAVDGTR